MTYRNLSILFTLFLLSSPTTLHATSQNRLKGQASTTIADTAPIVLSTGVLMATPEAGAIEYNGTSLFYTNESNSRKKIIFDGSQWTTTATSIYYTTGNVGPIPTLP